LLDSKQTSAAASSASTNAARTAIVQALEGFRKGDMKRSEAVKQVALQLKAPKTIVYALALKIPWQ
jgi:predicted transcriptional regulator YheO